MLFRSNDTATTEIYTLSLHDALPIWSSSVSGFQPESSTASVPATIARWMKRSIFFWSFTGTHSEMSSRPSAAVPG